MNMHPRKLVLSAALCCLFASSPLFAQDAMAGMDMSTPQTAPKVAKPRAKPARQTPTKQTPAAKPASNAGDMSGMDMSSMPGKKPDPNLIPAQDNSMQGMDMQGGSMQGMDRSRSTAPATMHAMGESMPGMDQVKPPTTTGQPQQLHAGQQIGVRPVVRGLGLKAMSGDAMQGMPPMQGGSAPPNARSPDYSEGVGYGDMTGMDMDDDRPETKLLIDKLEYAHGRGADATALDAQAWYGNDLNKLWLKADGQYSGGRLQELRSEALWDHAIATYWSTQLGVRHDFGVGPGRNWAAFGVQGLAPYWFDIEATAYVGSSGRTAARFEAEYELLLTQRLIFQPDLEINLYGRDDPQRRIGSGLSDVDLGLRLRYEIHRQFAPYVGIDLVRRFGRTADLVRAEGEHAFDPQLVAGVRIWF